MVDFLLPAQEPEDWRRLLAEPDKHWRTGYSAKALAYCWQTAGDFPPEVRRVFDSSSFELFHRVEMLLGIPELRVPLPGGRRPSQTDLFVLAKSAGELVSIAVEGKVSEEFDALVAEWLIRGRAPVDQGAGAMIDPEIANEDSRSPLTSPVPSRGKQRRLAYLCQKLSVSEEAARDLRYQLLRRTVSALILAETFNARHALMLVHSFSQTLESFDDYGAFAALLGVKVDPDAIVYVADRAGIDLYLGWVTGDVRWLEA